MTIGFQPATKTGSKLRAAIFGPSGSGKTFTALRLARGLSPTGKIALIDTERGSARKYADRFTFSVCELDDDRSIEACAEAISAARGHDVLIIDSMTHSWLDLVDQNQLVADARFKGNTWAAWSVSRPKQRNLIDAILAFPGHVIACMRVKTEWQTNNDGGRFKATRIGLAPRQEEGIEYEFDLLIEMSPEHVGNILKDRTGKFQDKIIDKPGEPFGEMLAAWLGDVPVAGGAEQPAPSPAAARPAPKPATPPEDNEPLPTPGLAPEAETDAAGKGENIYRLAEVTSRSGKKDNRPWTIWSIVTESGIKFATFDETAGTVAEAACEARDLVDVQHEEGARGLKIKTIAVVNMGDWPNEQIALDLQGVVFPAEWKASHEGPLVRLLDAGDRGRFGVFSKYVSECIDAVLAKGASFTAYWRARGAHGGREIVAIEEIPF